MSGSRLVAALVVLVALALLPGTARAGKPFFVTVDIDRAKILSDSAHVCDFPIEVHEVGTWELSFHLGNNGVFREIRHAQLTTTYTNTLTGASVAGKQTRGLNIKYDVETPVEHPDGSITFTDEFVGAFQTIVIPGVGRVGPSSGRLLTTHTIAADGTLIASNSTVLAGRGEPLSEKVCALLD